MITLAVFEINLRIFGSSMLIKFLLAWVPNFFDMTDTDEYYVDGTGVCRIKL